MTYRVLATDRVALAGLTPLLDDDAFEVLEVHDSASDEFAVVLRTASALIVRSATKVTAALMANAPELMAIGRAGVGIDNVDVASASQRGIAVFNAPGGNTIAAAELTMGLMLSLARKIPQADSSLRAGRWDRAAFKGVEIKGKTLGLIGAGRIGSEVAIRCRAFGMNILVYDPYLTIERVDEMGFSVVELEEVLDKGDFVSIHVPLNEETHGLCDAAALRRMKPTAFLVNASRGGVVDEVALAKALHNGDLAGAALDVYEAEPLPPDSPLRDTPNLVLTPHIGASTAEAQLGVATEVALQIESALLTGDVSAAVNFPELRHARVRRAE